MVRDLFVEDLHRFIEQGHSTEDAIDMLTMHMLAGLRTNPFIGKNREDPTYIRTILSRRLAAEERL